MSYSTPLPGSVSSPDDEADSLSNGEQPSAPSMNPVDSPPTSTSKVRFEDLAGASSTPRTPVDFSGEVRELTKRTASLEALLQNLKNAMHFTHGERTSSAPPSKLSQEVQVTSTPSIPSSAQISGSSSNFSGPLLRDALELVPSYDGHSIPVLEFARACKRVKELVPLTDEAYLVRLLRNKLKGRAYLVIEDETHDTVDRFLEALKFAFRPSRTPNYYRGQLSVCFKKPNEHIIDFIGKIKDLRNAIIEGDQNLLGRELTPEEISSINADTLDAFVEGIPPDLRAEIRLDGFNSLPEAYSKAIYASKRLERHQTRFSEPQSRPSQPSWGFSGARPPALNPPVTILQRPQSRAPAPVVQTPSPHVSAAFPTKICGYCNRMGHLTSECFKRQRITAANQQGNAQVVSAEGASRGHLSTPCPLLPIENNLQPSTSSDPQPRPQQ